MRHPTLSIFRVAPSTPNVQCPGGGKGFTDRIPLLTQKTLKTKVLKNPGVGPKLFSNDPRYLSRDYLSLGLRSVEDRGNQAY